MTMVALGLGVTDRLTCWFCGRTFWAEEAGECLHTRPQPMAVLILLGMAQVMTFSCHWCMWQQRIGESDDV